MQDGEKQERRAQDRRDAERERCWKGGIHERRYSGLEGFRTRGLQKKGYRKGGFKIEGMRRCMKGGMQERRDSRDEGCKLVSKIARIRKDDNFNLKETVFFRSKVQFRFDSLVKGFVPRNTKHSKLAFAC